MKAFVSRPASKLNCQLVGKLTGECELSLRALMASDSDGSDLWFGVWWGGVGVSEGGMGEVSERGVWVIVRFQAFKYPLAL